MPALVLIFLAACAPAPGSPPPTTAAPLPSPALAEDYSFLARPSAASIRVLSYNVNWDSIFPVGDPQSHELRTFSKGNAFVRIIQAVQPDIVCLQEINPERDAQQVADLLDDALNEDAWRASSTRDSLIATHFDLQSQGYYLDANSTVPGVAQAGSLVDLPDDRYGSLDIYIVCAHFKAGGNLGDVLMRRRQADMIMYNLRDLMTPGDNMDIPEGTPFLIMGDFNIYETDEHTHLNTLLTGDIDNEDRYGLDFDPDWDSTSLADAMPSHNAAGVDFYTWRDDQGIFQTEFLDRIIYPDSVLTLQNAFILDTTQFTPEALEQYGLQEYDVVLNPATGYYDHFPLVADFYIIPLNTQ